jgi:hypothetical protein
MVVKEPASQFEPAPAGTHAAVCVDIVDMGFVPNRFEPEKAPVPTVRLVWQIGENMKDGKPFLIRKDYRASLHEKSALRKDLTSWRGRPFTAEELAGFDLEKVYRAPCILNIVQKQGTKGGTFSNIAAMMPLPKGMIRLESRDYIRVKDRPATVSETTQPQPHAPEPPAYAEGVTDDDVPF